MTTLSGSTVDYIARLAALPIPQGEEHTLLTMNLSAIIEFVSKLQEVNINNVSPTSQVTGLTNVIREDEIDTSRMLSQTQALSNTAKTHNGFFVVPKIFE